MWALPDSQRIRKDLLEHLAKAGTANDLLHLGRALEGVIELAAERIAEDLAAYALRDPASLGKAGLIFETYASFRAVICYRLAHAVWQLDAAFDPVRERMAQMLSNNGKLLSGIEIHPAAQIGRRFVLDHGFGTVVGETSEFGDDCYICSGVILGATGIAGNAGGKRHPRLGNRVEVGSGARIFGPVVVGDDVFISPSCVITQDVPAGVKVRVVNQVLVHKHLAGTGPMGFLSAFALHERLHVVGELSAAGDVFLLDADHRHLRCLVMECTSRDVHHLQYRMRRTNAAADMPRFPLHVRIATPNQDLTLLDPPGLGALVHSLLQPAERALAS